MVIAHGSMDLIIDLLTDTEGKVVGFRNWIPDENRLCSLN